MATVSSNSSLEASARTTEALIRKSTFDRRSRAGQVAVVVVLTARCDGLQ